MSALAALALAQEISLSGPLLGASHDAFDERRTEFMVDMRMPVRYGFAYSGVVGAPEVSYSLGIDVDVAPITKNLTLDLALDFESNAEPQISSDDRRSSIGDVALGAGVFYLTDADVAFGVDVTCSITYDLRDVVGAGFAARAYVYPFYVRIADWAEKKDVMTAVRSSFSFWVLARAYVTHDGNGPIVAFGGAFDLVRIFALPYAVALSHIK